MFNEYLIHLFNCTCLNVMCVCSTIYRSIQKKRKNIFDHFICFLKWFLSLFVFIFSAYFVFHCLNIFCVEKQVSEFFATHSRLTRDSFCDSQVTQRKLQVHPKAFATHLVTHENFHDSLNRKTLKNSFLKGFSWETYFKSLLSSLNSLFQYFYI